MAKKVCDILADIHSIETRAIRIDRTALKQSKKSELLRRLVAKYGELGKWERIARTYDSRQHP